jgi:hypothetical protein
MYSGEEFTVGAGSIPGSGCLECRFIQAKWFLANVSTDWFPGVCLDRREELLMPE